MNRFIISPLTRARLPRLLSRTHSTAAATDQKPKPTPIQLDGFDEQPKTHFGYRDVPEQAKQSLGMCISD
jgi:hypothetical protein